MKQYVWIAVIFLFTGAQASENPFDLGENLKKIDQDQDILLLELKKMSQKKEEQEEKVMNAQEGLEENRSGNNTAINEENVSSNSVVQKNEMNLTVEEERLKKVKEEQEKIEQARAEHEALKKAEVQAEQERLAEEKREVEKYEAQRLEKKKAEEKAAALLASQEKEEKLVAKPIQEKVTAEVKEDVLPVTRDINLTREKIDAVQEAEKAYLEAIKEVNQD